MNRGIASSIAALTLVLVAGCGGGGGSSASPASSSPTASSPSAASPSPVSPSPTAAVADYLALGDSVSFGYREPDSVPKPDFSDAASFVGFPQLAGKSLGLDVTNTACPGETSASFVTLGAASFGCEKLPSGGAGYRALYPLHVSYTGTQLSYALQFLKTHPDTKLITLMIGANDGFLCEQDTKDGCVSELSTLLTTVSGNVKKIMTALRTEAGYKGQIVIVDYYSLDYSSALQDAVSQQLNGAVNTAAAPYDVSVASGYDALKTASATSGGDTCKAGLLTKLSTGKCGVHPSATGQALLAGVVEKAYHR